MLETKLSLPFYGHVRQYHNIKAEMDAKIQEDLGSGQSVMGRCGRASPATAHRCRSGRRWHTAS